MPSPHVKRLLILLVSFALIAAACGGSDDSASEASGSDSDDGGSAEGSGDGNAEGLPDFMAVECPVDAHLDAGEPVEVVLWHTLVALTGQTIQDLATEYNASQELVTVRVESQGSAYIELENKYIGGIATNALPDIAVMEDILTRTLADSATVLPAQACLDAEGMDTADLNPVSTSFYSVEDQLLPAAWNASTNLFYFNKEHFRQAGLDENAPPQTIAEIREVAEALQASGIESIKEPLVMKVGAWFFEAMLNNDGIGLLNNDNGRSGAPTEVNFTDPAVVSLFTEFQSLVDDGLMLAVPEQPGQADHFLALATQTASMGIETSTAATSVEAFLKGELDIATLTDPANASAEDAADLSDLADADLTEFGESLDIGAARLPGISGPGAGQMGGNGWYMMSTSPPEVQAAAWDFMKFVRAEDQQALLFTQGSFLPMTPSSLDRPEVTELFENSLAASWLKISNDQLSDITPDAPGAQVGAYRDVRDSLQSAIDLIMAGEDVETTLADAAEEANSAIEEYNDEFDLN